MINMKQNLESIPTDNRSIQITLTGLNDTEESTRQDKVKLPIKIETLHTLR